MTGETVAGFPAPNAKQAMAVDKHHIYAISNYRNTKHHKQTGEPLQE